MEFSHESLVPRDAATIMIVRDGPTRSDGAAAGIEVLMLLKTLKADFAGGAYVFPGGAVDGSDREPGISAYCDGLDDEAASAILEIGSGGLGFWVAAVRECFEEAGILLADRADGTTVATAAAHTPGTDDAQRFHDYRAKVEKREISFARLCEAEGLRLPMDRIHYVSHWITPDGAPRRYDTRFFVAVVPGGQTALNDGSETVENCWIAPADALERGKSGEFQLIFPTISNLQTIGRFTDVAGLMAFTKIRRNVPTVAPRVAIQGKEIRFILPGDAGYDDGETGSP